ncbi:MAG: FAD-dependent oxidoreductase [Candidatus Nanohaloarchaea archaeon]|nr:FAD-dependent oxidoreductase [Candidatus Nanohaloarchaea archaeon]
MTDVIVVGDGPAGLQAALLLAKNGMETVVYGTDETYMHDAYLYNYLGIDEVHGSDFMETARQQVEDHGAELVDAEVVDAAVTGDDVTVETAGGEEAAADYLVLTEGDARGVAESVGLETTEDGAVNADKYGNTSEEGVYAGGWTARDNRIQAAISVGDGAAIALTILSEEKGTEFHDFDVPE